MDPRTTRIEVTSGQTIAHQICLGAAFVRITDVGRCPRCGMRVMLLADGGAEVTVCPDHLSHVDLNVIRRGTVGHEPGGCDPPPGAV